MLDLKNLSPESIVLAIGDIHGCLHELNVILTSIEKYDGPLVLLGDYVDRGPSSFQVIEKLIELKANRPRCHFLIGNHDQVLLDWHKAGESDYLDTDEFTSLREYMDLSPSGLPTTHASFLEGLQYYLKIENLVFAHGGISHRAGSKPLAEQPKEDFILTRSVAKTWKGETVVSGHSVVESPMINPNHILLDTGCYKTGKLTCGILDMKAGRLLGYLQTIPNSSSVFQTWFY